VGGVGPTFAPGSIPYSPGSGSRTSELGLRLQRCVAQAPRYGISLMAPDKLEDEASWLRHRIVRMRTVLRFAKDPRAEAGLRELIADAEARLAALEAKR
jgi:hypothetical protein